MVLIARFFGRVRELEKVVDFMFLDLWFLWD
jgi:hypothetical protein